MHSKWCKSMCPLCLWSCFPKQQPSDITTVVSQVRKDRKEAEQKRSRMSAGKKKGAPETAFGPTKSSGASKFSKSSPGPPEARQKSRGVGRGGQHADQQRLRLCALWCARLKSQHARLCLLADVRSNSCQGTGQSMQPRSRHGYFLPVLWPSGSAWSWLVSQSPL